MLCAVKRGRESGAGLDEQMTQSEPSCSPGRAFMLESPAGKRTRLQADAEQCAGEAGPASNSPFCGASSEGAPHRGRPAMPLPPYPSHVPPLPPAGAPPPHLPSPWRNNRRPSALCPSAPRVVLTRGTACAGATSACDAGLTATLRQRCDPHTGELLFNLDQVRDIVRRAVDEKERTLRDQYDRILQQKLQEQFRSFAKFNEDYISRQLKTGDLSYCS